MSTKAHGDSLPLFMALQRLEGKSAYEAFETMRVLLKKLGLEDHVYPVIVGESIELKHESPYGASVLSELKARSEFPPCADDEHEYATSQACIWCGKIP